MALKFEINTAEIRHSSSLRFSLRNDPGQIAQCAILSTQGNQPLALDLSRP